jgi:fatty acid desaturase
MLDPVRAQVLTARNVKGHPITDWFYGGLNYQIEHHLFPSMARTQLGKAQPIVRTFCEERGIAYYETSVVRSYVEILSSLHVASAPLRA